MDDTNRTNYMTNNPVAAIPMVDALKQLDEYNEQTVTKHPFQSSILATQDMIEAQKLSFNNSNVVPMDTTDSKGDTPCPPTPLNATADMKQMQPSETEMTAANSSEVQENQKRKSLDTNDDNNYLAKKQQFCQMSEEKKKSALRKNIREVMDSNQLDTNTLRAQHEESERLARVAEQQKLLREYQQREAVLTHFDRFVNEHRVRDPADLLPLQKKTNIHKASGENYLKTEKTSSTLRSLQSTDKDMDMGKSADEKDESLPSEVVTIEDSSDDDDCIVLSDDEAEIEDDNENDDPNNSGMHVKDAFNVPDHLGRVVINVGHPEDEEDIFIAPQIARTIKPHQIGGVRFLFDNIIESIKRFKSSGGFGCILAHSMGLGKTLQVVCFCDIFLRYTPSKYVVCVMPINTLQNWNAEFDMWIPKQSENTDYIRPRHFDVFVLNDQQKTLTARAKVILQWKERGGVLLIGYELYRLLALKLSTTGKRRSKKFQAVNENCTESRSRVMDEVYEALVKPGPDLIICDEGHRIKNAQAGISQALKQIRTRRRIVLTGYPLQNNLLEYWCMVDFVRPNYLGTRTEFCNMFERPIQNGLCIDSTPDDIKLMRYRAHVLHSLLVGFVQRRSHTVLQQSLPEKQEFVILTRMSELQKQLYDTFMNDIVRTKNVPNPLKAFAVCCKIWNHPDVLYDAMKMADSGLDWDIEEVDDIPITSSGNKNGFPTTEKPPVTGSLNDSVEKPPTPVETQTSLLKSSVQFSDTNTLSANHFQNDLPETSQIVSKPVSATKPNCYNGSTLFPEINQYDSPALGNVSYNQDMQSSYFSYPSMMSAMGRPLQPNYVGCMLKQNESTNADESHNSSSEIVDLDTNEIRTIETDIDMDKNFSINKDEKSDKSDKSSTINETDKSETDSHFSSSVGISENNEVEQKKVPDKITYDWAMKFMKKYEPGLIVNSPKMEIFFCILNESICIGDRVLLFSQSLLTLNLIEKFLQANRIPGEDSNWTYNKHYFRLDGSTTSQEREKYVNEFNSNTNIKLFLISTKAGSLGINLVGANRVIIFDASWNPCHDTQAIYRIYRYGQRRACFIYRLVMDRCLEKKIYDRQIKKQGMSDRVVDECNPDAHLSIKDVTNLCYDYDDDDDKTNTFEYIKPLESYTDTIMKKILTEYKTCLTKEPFFHESLLIDRKNDKLSQAEKRLAHRSYEMQKKTSAKQTIYTNSSRIQYQTVRKDGSLITRPVASVRPIQAPRNQTAQKHSSGLRTTRWIPAEVWQKQGMTAQEMSLPLDVVIPTNSSNKSKIIIKAGQRVMVLKSAKGIYMQLDSGKIIAIRTMNKPNVSTSEKSDVIDITGETETAASKETPETDKTDSETTTPPANKDSDLTLNNSLLKNANEEVPKETPNQLNMYNTFSNVETNAFNKKPTLETDKQPKTNLTATTNSETQEQSTSLRLGQRQQTPMQQQQAQQMQTLSQPQQPQQQQQHQNTHATQNQTLNEQHLQQSPSQIQAPTQIMHSQSPATYSQHQTYASYTQHQTLRNSTAHYTTVEPGDINSYNSYPPTQYTDYPPYGSQQQTARYHAVSSAPSHTSIAPVIHSQPPHPPTSTNTQTAATSHPPTLSDFYSSYYPQWSTFMLTTPTPSTNENAHLMHSSYTPLAAQSHSHSHHAKVQSNSQPWPQYHP